VVVSPFMEDLELVMTTRIHRITDPAEVEDPIGVKCVFDKEDLALYASRSLVPFGCDGAQLFEKMLG
jgi:CMP-2-keto-3-deoxyoctulosonic acid synthetase